MSITTNTYVRKPIYVDAVQVTEENFDTIAGWCGGEIKETMSLRNRPVRFIHVPVTRPQTERQEQARVGDWILTSERGYKVYTPKAFTVAFDKVNEVKAQSYPYPDGDTLVLGPEVFVANDQAVISWKGENFYTIEQASTLLTATVKGDLTKAVDAHMAAEAVCNRCGAPKGLQAVGEACNNNCGGRVVANAHTPHPEQQVMDTAPNNPEMYDEVVAERRVIEADIRNQAASGKITASDAERTIERLETPIVPAVGTLPMPKQNLGDAGLPESAVASPPTETPKAADAWARVERGEITGEQARAILGQAVVAAAPVAVPETRETDPSKMARIPEGDPPGEVDPPFDTPAVGTQPMPEQPEHTDVEERQRPPALPPHMRLGGYVENVKTGERTEAVHIPVETEVVTYTNAEVAALKAEQGIPTIEANTNEGDVQHMSTPEDPSTHVGVDQSEDEAPKAGIDLTDETALKAADEDEQLAADAMRED